MFLRTCKCFISDATSKRVDPTGTMPISKKLEREILRRLRRIKVIAKQALVELDVMGMKKSSNVSQKINASIFSRAYSPAPKAFMSNSPSERIASFNQWIKELIENEVLESPPGTTLSMAINNSWANKFVEMAYNKGRRDARTRVQKSNKALLKDSFGHTPEDVIKLLQNKMFTNLRGITENMSTRISRMLSEGVSEGLSINEIAENIADEIDISITRARTLARTEIISAYSEASLDFYEEAEIEGVRLEAEFVTAGDDQVCEECEELEGNTYEIDEARGLIPVHPNCRCAILPLVE